MPWRTAAASSGRKPPGTRRPAATNQLRLRQHPQQAGAPAAFAITGTAQVLVLCVRWSPLRTLGLYVLRGLAAVALPGP